MADAPPYRHPHGGESAPPPYPPDPRMWPPARRTDADGLRRARQGLHTAGNILLAVAAVAGLATAACMWYLSRGVYDPADVLVLLAQCLAIVVCLSAAIAALMAHAAGFAASVLAGRRATAAADDVRASGPAPVPDRPDGVT